VKRGDVANPVTFHTNSKAIAWWADAPGKAELVENVRRIRCGMETRGFCGHCTNGIPLVPALETAQPV
jgi:hypothetical protein